MRSVRIVCSSPWRFAGCRLAIAKTPSGNVALYEMSKSIGLKYLSMSATLFRKRFISQTRECLPRFGKGFSPMLFRCQLFKKPLGKHILLSIREFGGFSERLL